MNVPPLADVIQKWEKKYQAQSHVFGAEPTDFLKETLPLLKESGPRLLVPGDGDGRNGVWLAQNGFQVEANDGAQSGVNNANLYAQKLNLSAHYHSQVADLRDWEARAQHYDGVVNMHVHFEPDERVRFNHMLGRAMRPGAVLVIELFHPEQVALGFCGPRTIEICVTPEDLHSDFKEMDIQLCERAEKTIAPSAFHNGGPCVVTRLIAQKPL